MIFIFTDSSINITKNEYHIPTSSAQYTLRAVHSDDNKSHTLFFTHHFSKSPFVFLSFFLHIRKKYKVLFQRLPSVREAGVQLRARNRRMIKAKTAVLVLLYFFGKSYELCLLLFFFFFNE